MLLNGICYGVSKSVVLRNLKMNPLLLKNLFFEGSTEWCKEHGATVLRNVKLGYNRTAKREKTFTYIRLQKQREALTAV